MEALYGIDEVLPIRFDRQMRDMPWEQFLHSVLLGQYHAAALICGHDFRFGARGAGTAARLLEACAKLGIGCAVIPEYRLEGDHRLLHLYPNPCWSPATWTGRANFWGIPTSSPVRWCLEPVWARTPGAPTANLKVSPELLLPPHGVYACRVWVQGRRTWR